MFPVFVFVLSVLPVLPLFPLLSLLSSPPGLVLAVGVGLTTTGAATVTVYKSVKLIGIIVSDFSWVNKIIVCCKFG